MDSRFTLERKGYNRSEVDDCLSKLQQELQFQLKRVEKLTAENAELRESITAMKKREMLIEDTIVNAQLAADHIREDAEKSAKQMVAERLGEAEQKLLSLERREQDIKAMEKRVKYVLQSQLAVMDKEE